MSLNDIQKNWEALGKSDPLWAIFTDPSKKGGKWDEETFFATGKAEVDRIMSLLAQRYDLKSKRSALDFGCGVGRLTAALAGHFEQVTGVDIASSMVDLARKYDRGGAKCSFVVNTANNLRVFPDQSFDFLYSAQVLQHNPPQHAKEYIVEFIRVLRPGGVAIFQLPSAAPATEPRAGRSSTIPVDVVRRVKRWLTARLRPKQDDEGRMEHNFVPRPEVESLLRECGAKVLAVDLEPECSPGWTSYFYTAMRP